MNFHFDLSRTGILDDGNNSPRSKVAHRFRGLALGGEGGGGTADGPPDAGDIAGSPSKRPRPGQMAQDVPQPVGITDNEGNTVPEPLVTSDIKETTEGTLQRAYPSINRLSESKSRGKKRSGTPPLRLRKGPILEVDDEDDEDEDDEMEIVDPVRAALTWHEHEITVYDPDDEDDDGTGINGIGFKPTPALAHARAAKRRQQMAEYRKREESDARARRSQRRHKDAPAVAVGLDEGSPARKVRFTEADLQNIAITTG
jgi:hypothetical protein